MTETQTANGLRTTVALLASEDPTGEKVPSDYEPTMRIVFDDELTARNYRAMPSKKGS